ncbi:MAG: DegT/DnrJ/EryC1/StrS family aminotransferase [Thermodesulfobacteriota bacterium]
MERIPVAGPWITEKEVSYVADAVRNAWYENNSIYHNRFEAAFAAYVGRKYAMALPSCTSALHLSLASLDLKPDDEIIVPEITWIASSAPISYVNAKTVFADIDSKTWCLSVQSLIGSITPKTRAVILVDLYGNMPDMDGILETASRHGIAVIEDAAQSLGAEYKKKKAGSFGLASTFSFHGTKTLTTGEGGMLLTDDETMFNRCQFLRDHGRKAGGKMFWNTEIGYKYRMSNMQAALGLAQLERIEELIERKREIFSWYYKELANIEGLMLNYEPYDVKNTYWMVTIIPEPRFRLTKEDIIKAMSERGIDCRPFFYPLSSLPAYSGCTAAEQARGKNTIAYQISQYGVNLPSSFHMTREKVTFVCDKLKEILSDP